MIRSTKYIGRAGGLAIALGTGAWLASVPWLAAADPADTSALDPTTLDPSALLGSPAADLPGLDLSVSYDGVNLFQSGDATADSFAGQGDLAIAYGDGATAYAGMDPLSSGPITLTAPDDYAFASGADSTAIADGVSSSAIASDGATAYSGFDSTSLPSGGDDFASASGAGSLADAFGNGDIVDVSGAGSTATAGFDNDFVAVLGNDLSALATGSDQFVTDPSLFVDAATGSAAAVPVDDFGLSSLAGDLSSFLNLF